MFADAELLRDGNSAVEAVRNCFDVVLTYLGEWGHNFFGAWRALVANREGEVNNGMEDLEAPT